MDQKYASNYDRYNQYNYINRSKRYDRRIPNIPEKYLNLLNKTWSSPSVISNSVLLSVPLEKFLYTEKIDGLHTHILIFDKKIYNVSKNTDITPIDNFFIKEMNFTGDCILETEFYNNIYYIFDVYYLNGIDYSEKYILERIEPIKQFLNDLGPSFKIKNYYKIPDINFLLDYIKNDKSPEGNDIDGVILQRIDKPYFQEGWKEFNSYKLKPLHLNTIDFLLKYNYRDNSYDLYLKGQYFSDYYNNFKKLPKRHHIYKINNINQAIDGSNYKYKFYDNEKVLIYFDSPFYPNLGFMNIESNWNKNNYSQRAIKLINDLIDKMSLNPKSFNNKIVELSLTDDKKWVPLKVRDDKTLPNSYRVGLNNISIIFDPIKPSESIYFQKNLLISAEEQNVIHKINQIFRQFIIENHINFYGKYSSIIDLCGGRGADEFNLYSNGVSNFFVIDSDTTALKRYFDRTYMINNRKYEPLTHKYYYKLQWGRDFLNINFLNYTLDKDYQQIKKDLFSRYEFKTKKIKRVDIALMNFAIHYLCDEKEKLRKLCEFVESVLIKDGMFIITYFDGDKILESKNSNNVAKIGPFDIEIIKEEKYYTLAKMPLPTIKSGENIYKEEPLVLKKMIKILEKYFDLYDEYYVYDRCKEYIDKIDDNQNYIDFYRLIKVGVYYKKSQ